MLEFSSNRAAFDYFLEPAGVDVVLDLHSPALPVSVYQREPFPDSIKKHDILAETLERALSQRDTIGARLIEHQFHIGQHVGRVLPDCNIVTHLPELRRSLSDRLYKAEFLHITG